MSTDRGEGVGKGTEVDGRFDYSGFRYRGWVLIKSSNSGRGESTGFPGTLSRTGGLQPEWRKGSGSGAESHF